MFNKYAFVLVAVDRTSYLQSAAKVIELFASSGELLSESLINN